MSDTHNKCSISEEIFRAILSANSVAARFLSLHTDPVLPVMVRPESDIVSIPGFICQKFSYDLEILQMGGLTNIDAFVKRYESPNKLEIRYSSALNRCWSRFIICKEVSHLLLGHPGNSTIHLEEIQDLITQLLLPERSTTSYTSNPALTVEHTAFYSAMELLVPYQKRHELYGFLDAGQSHLDIAEFYRIPKMIVEYLDSEGGRQFFEVCYGGLNLDHRAR